MSFLEKKIIKKFKIINLSFFIIITIISIKISYSLIITTLNKKSVEEIQTISFLLSKNSQVINSLKEKKMNNFLNDYLNHIVIYNPKINNIKLINPEGTILYNIDNKKIGKKVSKNYLKASFLKDSSSLKTLKTDFGQETIAFSKIYFENSTIGLVSVSTLKEKINFSFNELFIGYSILILYLILIGFILLKVNLNLIKKFLLGYNPNDFKEKFLIKRHVLDSIDEGIISINLKGEIIFINKTAKKLINYPGDLHQKNIALIFPDTNLSKIFKDSEIVINKEVYLNDKFLLITELPIFETNKIKGATILIKNKTETLKLAENLTGSNHLVNALRANTHEFKNKMHVILGLLQTNNPKLAIDYISAINNSNTNFNLIFKVIHNKIIAALIYGKINYAKECDISLTLNKKSFLPDYNEYIGNHDLVTIIGNLLENSIDSIKEKKNSEDKNIHLFISHSDKGFIISVDDTGTGIKKEIRKKILERGFSTKGKNRGVGLDLIKNIVNEKNGIFNIDSEVNVGTSITIILKK